MQKNKKGVKPLEFHAFTYENLCLFISSLLDFLKVSILYIVIVLA